MNRSSIIIQPSKNNQVNSMGMMTKQFNLPQLTTFLCGYVIGDLGLTPINRDNYKIINKFKQSLDLIKDQIIEPRNLIEATMQGIQVAKLIQKKQKQQNQKKMNNNKMKSQYDSRIEQQKRSISQNFLQVFCIALSQLALDRNYLKSLWASQTMKQQQQRRSEQAIRKLVQQEEAFQKEKRKKDRKNMQEENQKLVRRMIQQEDFKIKEQQSQKLQCQICICEIQYSDMGTLQCGHMFHRGCLFQYIKASVQANKIDMACPMEDCNKPIATRDIQEYLQGDILQKYNKFSLNRYVELNNKDTSWCPTAGCPALFQFDEALDNYKCPACNKHYCLKCRCEYHYGMTCAEYRITSTFSKDDQKFQQFVRGAKFKQCPKCKFWVERSDGCSTMSCRCGTQFCYDCGGTACPHGSCSNSGKVISVPGIVPGIRRPGGGRRR